jgi:RNA polymerase sigma-70 factor, ECF subfamily
VPATKVDSESDALIVRVIRQGDQHAFAQLVRLNQSGVRATLRKLTKGNEALADDLAQETFLLAWRKISLFRFEAQFSTWLYRIAFNVYMSHARKSSEVLVGDLGIESDESTEEMAQRLLDSAAETSMVSTQRNQYEDAGATADVNRAMAVLSEPERAAIVACYHNDLSHEEASAALSMPLGTLKTHILKAKQKLKHALADYADA